jgi:hypothetical protein
MPFTDAKAIVVDFALAGVISMRDVSTAFDEAESPVAA